MNMLKRSFVTAAATGMALSFPLTALQMGNPLDATWLTEGILWEGNDYENSCLSLCDAWSFRVGYYGDFVFDRRLEVDNSPNNSDIRKTRIITNAGYLAFNVWNRYDLFVTLGETKFHIETPGSAFSLKGAGFVFNDTVEIETESFFSWSVGLRATLWECGKLGLGAEAQYFQTRPRLNYFEVPGYDVAYFDSRARTNYREYQVGLGVTYQIVLTECGTFVVPYVGAKWSRARFNLDDYIVNLTSPFTDPLTADMFNLDSHHGFGAVIGVTLVGWDRWSFTAEGRFANEVALGLNSQLRF